MSTVYMTPGDYVELDRLMRDYRKELARSTSPDADDAEIEMAQDTMDYLRRVILNLLTHSTQLGRERTS